MMHGLGVMLLLLLTVLPASLAHLFNEGAASHAVRLRRTVGQAFDDVHQRIRRDAEEDAQQAAILKGLLGGGEGGAGVGGLFCFIGCQDKFDKLGSSSEEGEEEEEGGPSMGLSFDDFFSSDGDNDTSSLAEELPQMCADFLDAKQCLEKCGEFPFRQLIVTAFGPLTFMCEKFEKYAPCFDEVAEPTECKTKCGDDQEFLTMKKADMKAKAAGEEKNSTAVVDHIGQMCVHLECKVDCMKPILVAACKSERAADLFEEFLGSLVQSVVGSFDTMGLADVTKPPQCQRLIELAGQPIVVEESNDQHELQMQKLRLELRVLGEESAKLNLETEVLKLQKRQLLKLDL